jgi:hypothetical protein
MTDAWLRDSHLLHPGFGLIPYQEQPLPFDQRDLPFAWTVLDEAVQDARLDEFWRLAVAWAGAQEADRVEGDFIRSDWPVAARAGLSQSPASVHRWSGAFSSEGLGHLMDANPERLWVKAGEELLLYLHETWDSLVVRGDEGAVEALRRDVEAFQRSRD